LKISVFTYNRSPYTNVFFTFKDFIIINK
jgi:hypothetical protein